MKPFRRDSLVSRRDSLVSQREAFAQEQGLVLVPVSPRRYLVIRITNNGGGYWSCAGEDQYHTHLEAEVAHGPADWNSCRAYIAKVGLPLPKDMLD